MEREASGAPCQASVFNPAKAPRRSPANLVTPPFDDVEVLVRREAEPIAVLLGRKVVTCRGQSLERRLDVADVKFRLGDSKPYLRDCRLGLTAVRLEEDGGGDFLVETRNGEEAPGLVQRDVTNARTAAYRMGFMSLSSCCTAPYASG